MCFRALTFVSSQSTFLNTRPIGLAFKHFRGTWQVLMQCNKHVWSLFMHSLPYSNQTLLKHLTLFVYFLALDFSKQNGVGCKLSNVVTSPQRHNRTQRFGEQKYRRMISLVRNAFLIYRHANNTRLILSIFKFKAMFKQHVNLLIWTWIFVHLTMG